MNLTREGQTELTRIAVKAGQILLQHGAESRLVEQITQRIGVALGAQSIELSVSSDAIVITSLFEGNCITTTRRCYDRGINMHMVCEVLRICVMLEKQLLDAKEVKERLARLEPYKYNRWVVVVMIGFSCSSFRKLIIPYLYRFTISMTFFSKAYILTSATTVLFSSENSLSPVGVLSTLANFR